MRANRLFCIGCKEELADIENPLELPAIGNGPLFTEIHCCEDCAPIVVNVLTELTERGGQSMN